MRLDQADIDKFLSRPLGLVAEFKTPMTFEVFPSKEIDPNKAFEKGKHRHVVFIGGKAFVPDPIEGKKVWKLRK